MSRFEDTPTPVAASIPPTVVVQSAPSAADDREKVLTLLASIQDSFKALEALTQTHFLTPSTIFLPQTLQKLSQLFTGDPELVPQALDYYDAVQLYSAIYYGHPQAFIDVITTIITTTRTGVDPKFALFANAMDDYTYTSPQDTQTFLVNSKPVLALYIYTLVKMTTHSTTE